MQEIINAPLNESERCNALGYPTKTTTYARSFTSVIKEVNWLSKITRNNILLQFGTQNEHDYSPLVELDTKDDIYCLSDRDDNDYAFPHAYNSFLSTVLFLTFKQYWIKYRHLFHSVHNPLSFV